MTEATIRTAGSAPTVGAGPESGRVAEDWGWAFIDLAALGDNRPRRYIVALLRIVAYPLAYSSFLGILAAFNVFGAHGRQVPPVAWVLATLGGVIVTGAAVAESIVRTHRRPLLSLVSPDLRLDWRRLAIGAATQGALALAGFAFLHYAAGEKWLMHSTVSLSVLGLTFVLVPFQAASEEILFRGYLTQALGRVCRSRAKIVTTVALVFAAFHIGAYGPLTVPYMFVVSVFLSVVSLRDGRLELAIGAHAAVNWIGIGLLDGLAQGRAAPHISWIGVAVLAVECMAFYATTRLLVRRCCNDTA